MGRVWLWVAFQLFFGKQSSLADHISTFLCAKEKRFYVAKRHVLHLGFCR